MWRLLFLSVYHQNSLILVKVNKIPLKCYLLKFTFCDFKKSDKNVNFMSVIIYLLWAIIIKKNLIQLKVYKIHLFHQSNIQQTFFQYGFHLLCTHRCISKKNNGRDRLHHNSYTWGRQTRWWSGCGGWTSCCRCRPDKGGVDSHRRLDRWSKHPHSEI